MQNDLIYEGLTLMLAGMGTVFVFLTALVIAMTVMAGLVARFETPVDAGGATDDEIAAIAAAITEHRRNK
jgi:oxaloacetate decarboxylase gamma subunit